MGSRASRLPLGTAVRPETPFPRRPRPINNSHLLPLRVLQSSSLRHRRRLHSLPSTKLLGQKRSQDRATGFSTADGWGRQFSPRWSVCSTRRRLGQQGRPGGALGWIGAARAQKESANNQGASSPLFSTGFSEDGALTRSWDTTPRWVVPGPWSMCALQTRSSGMRAIETLQALHLDVTGGSVY